MTGKAKKLRRLIKSIWVFNWFNSCGFTELVPVVGSRWDMERFGMVVTGTPRHADVLFIAGYQTHKSIRRAKIIFEQMAEPKVVIGLGACSMTGGMYWDSYNTIKRLEDYLPVNMYVPGCPPRPEAVFEACEKIFQHVLEMKDE
ncbi:MAG: NADH-quinone oxidoreductase subunit B [Candidatus Altiarchaeales archaeon ex4484_96]|nr:MAG: NADH-quinone oxidoreductase subunit B [Candidatus Altiarchaeales archaeon ex4484_96]